MAIFGTLPTVRAQTAPLTWLQPAFVYLDELFRPGTAAYQKIKTLAAGETFRRELAGGLFALEQAYLTKPRAEGLYESHRKYLDVQVIFEGEELMEAADSGSLAVRDPYNFDRDLIFYHDAPHGSTLRVRTGGAAVFFPADGHKPGLQLAGPQLVRKAVVKVPLPA